MRFVLLYPCRKWVVSLVWWGILVIILAIVCGGHPVVSQREWLSMRNRIVLL